MPTDGRRVLIAERDDELRKALLRELVRRNFDVTATAVPRVAVKMLRFVDVAVFGDCLERDSVLGIRSSVVGDAAVITLGDAVAPRPGADLTLDARTVPDVVAAVERLLGERRVGTR